MYCPIGNIPHRINQCRPLVKILAIVIQHHDRQFNNPIRGGKPGGLHIHHRIRTRMILRSNLAHLTVSHVQGNRQLCRRSRRHTDRLRLILRLQQFKRLRKVRSDRTALLLQTKHRHCGPNHPIQFGFRGIGRNFLDEIQLSHGVPHLPQGNLVRCAFPLRSTHPPPFVRYHSPGPHKLGITPALLMAQILGNKTQNPAINML